MIPITSRPNGFTLQFRGLLNLDEMEELSRNLHDEWAGLRDPFVLVIDARQFRYFASDAQARFEHLLEESLQHGLVRITVLAISTALANLFCSIMVRTDVMPYYQYLDVAYEDDFLTEMKNWLNEPFSNEERSTKEPS